MFARPHLRFATRVACSQIACVFLTPFLFSWPRHQVHALAHFPSLDRERERIVPAVDASGSRYQLRFRYWVNNQSRMYVLEGCQPPDVRAPAWPPWQPLQAALWACSRPSAGSQAQAAL